MRDRRLWVILVAALAALAMLPAQAIPDVTPTFVAGSSNCASVGSTGTQVTVFEPAVGVNPVNVPGVVGGQIQIFNVERKEFDFTATGVVVLDVVVKGSGSNHYDYGLSGIAADDGLKIPNGNKLNWVHFCYVEVPTITLSGTKFHDRNIDGQWDNELEDGLSGWTITATPTEGESVSSVTESDGSWELEVVPGSYTICESAAPEETFGQSFPANTNCSGQYPGGHIGNYVEDTSGLNFGNYTVTLLGCGGTAELEGTDSADASFTRGGEGCEGPKPHATEITGFDEVIFDPGEGAASTYTGTITFVKPLQNPIPALLYDESVFNGEDNFDEVPPCQAGIPPEGDSWCITGVSVSSEESQMTITWSLFGTGDPRFK